jgi:DNA-binding TFAR19-related protein (PDSD5 family)
VNRISLVRPQQTKQIEDLILQQAQSGRARVISEDDIIKFLSQVSEASQTHVQVWQ